MDRRLDIAVALGLAIIGAVVLVVTQDIRPSPIPDPIGPRGVPAAVGLITLIGGVGLAVRRLLRWRREGTLVAPEGAEDDKEVAPGSALRAMSIWVISLLYVLVLPLLGFILATPILLGIILGILGYGQKRIFGVVPSIIVVIVGFTIIAHVVFGTVLGVRLPMGLLEPLLR